MLDYTWTISVQAGTVWKRNQQQQTRNCEVSVLHVLINFSTFILVGVKDFRHGVASSISKKYIWGRVVIWIQAENLHVICTYKLLKTKIFERFSKFSLGQQSYLKHKKIIFNCPCWGVYTTIPTTNWRIRMAFLKWTAWSYKNIYIIYTTWAAVLYQIQHGRECCI